MGRELARLGQVGERTGGVAAGEFHHAGRKGGVSLQSLGADLRGHLVQLGGNVSGLFDGTGSHQYVDRGRQQPPPGDRVGGLCEESSYADTAAPFVPRADHKSASWQ